jgi:hypothetical protein
MESKLNSVISEGQMADPNQIWISWGVYAKSFNLTLIDVFLRSPRADAKPIGETN